MISCKQDQWPSCILQTEVDEIDTVLEAMTAVDQAARPSAQEALGQIGKIYHSILPQSLLYLAEKHPPDEPEV